MLEVKQCSPWCDHPKVGLWCDLDRSPLRLLMEIFKPSFELNLLWHFCDKFGKFYEQYFHFRPSIYYPLSSYSNTKCFFITSWHAHFCFCGRLMSIYLIDQYQNAIPRAMSLHELKKVQLQELFKLMTHDLIGHLNTPCMSVLSLSDGVESEWKCCSSLLNIEKMLAF